MTFLQKAIAVTVILIITSYLYWQGNPLYEKELTVYDFIDESHVVQDSRGFFN